MIVYQLPGGNIVYLTVDQFLRLSEEDIKYMDTENFGSDGNNPYKKLPTSSKNDNYNETHDDSIDYDYNEDDEPNEPFDLNNLPED